MAAEQGDITKKTLPTAETLEVAGIPGPIGFAGHQLATHTVSAGQSLEEIARIQYGDKSLWPRIFFANQGVLGVNHKETTPGQTLVIPAIWTK